MASISCYNAGRARVSCGGFSQGIECIDYQVIAEYVQKSLSVRTHICPSCGFVADRDVNAAINILQARTGPSRKVQQ